MSRRSRLAVLLLAFFPIGCSRCSSDLESAPANGKPSAATSVRAAEPRRDSPAPKPAAPPVTPDLPPQLVACGERDFYRITQSSLQVFEIARELPPPQIRGSRVARQTTEVAVDEPLNVFSPAKKSVLVIAKRGVFRYEADRTRALRYAAIPASAPLEAWPDPRRAESFRARTVGGKGVEEYTLPALPSGDADSDPPKVARRVTVLPGFDARLLTVLADGTLLYSTREGLVTHGDEARPTPFPEPSGPATLLFADSSSDRFWAADAEGTLALWDRKRGAAPKFTARIPGVVIDTAREGDRVAVLGMELVGETYRPSVTIFSNGKQQGRLGIGPSIGLKRQPQLDLCLVAGRPWVVVGNTRWLQLLDWESRRLLAEW